MSFFTDETTHFDFISLPLHLIMKGNIRAKIFNNGI